MSYTILYRRLFIKLPSGRYLPLIQYGDNNVYDVNPFTRREVRSRSWEVCDLGQDGNFPAVTRSEIEAYLEKQKQRAIDKAMLDLCEDDNPGRTDWKLHFGWYQSVATEGRKPANTSYGAFRKFFLQGIENAIPLAEFVRTVGPLQMVWYEKPAGEQFGSPKKGYICETEEGLASAWSHARKLANDGGPWIVPVNDLCVEAVADVLNARKAASGYTATVRYQDEPGRKFIRTLIPFTLTDSRQEAFIFTKALVNGDTLFRGLRLIKEGLKDLCFETT